MSLAGAIQQLAVTLGTLTGMRSAPPYPPETAAVFPFAVAYAASGDYTGGSLGKILTRERHSLAAEIHVARRELARSVAAAVPYADLLRTALQADPSLNDEVMVIESLGYRFGPLSWNGIDTIGYTFDVTVLLEGC